MSDSRHRQVSVNVKCSCKGYNLDKLLQPMILTLLTGRNLHGYAIIQELQKKNFGEKFDNAGFYRTLKSLTIKGLVDYEWIVEANSPAKKVYKITGSGIECLANWIQTLGGYKNAIEAIISDAVTTIQSI